MRKLTTCVAETMKTNLSGKALNEHNNITLAHIILVLDIIISAISCMCSFDKLNICAHIAHVEQEINILEQADEKTNPFFSFPVTISKIKN